VSLLRGWKERNVLSVIILGIIKPTIPIKKTLTIKEVEEIQAIEEESSEEEDKNDGFTWVTLDIRELL